MTNQTIPLEGNPNLRKQLYNIYLTFGAILGTIPVGFTAAGADVPVWAVVALAVYAYLGTAFGFTASRNVHVE